LRLAVAALTVRRPEDLKLKYPTLTKEMKDELLEAVKC
jgi:hypothetical protein